MPPGKLVAADQSNAANPTAGTNLAPPFVLRVNAALSGKKKAAGAAPAGGIALILGWASMAFLKR